MEKTFKLRKYLGTCEKFYKRLMPVEKFSPATPEVIASQSTLSGIDQLIMSISDQLSRLLELTDIAFAAFIFIRLIMAVCVSYILDGLAF